MPYLHHHLHIWLLRLTPDGTITLNLDFNGDGNIDFDPMFVDPANGNLRVFRQSPVIDNGRDVHISSLTEYDVLHNPRVHGDSVDIGAYENYCPQIPDPIYVHANASDNNTGSSWADAFTVLDEGMDQACYCDSNVLVPVWVAKGTYLPTRSYLGSGPTSATFIIEKNVQLYGGFAGH